MTQEFQELLDARLDYQHIDDFLWFISPHMWTSAVSGGTAAAQSDAANGIINLVTGATSNNSTWVRSTNAFMLLAADAPLVVESSIQFTEQNTNKMMCCMGFADTVGNGLLADTSGAATIVNTGAIIYKLTNSTVWRCNSNAAAGTASDTVSDQTAGGTAYQKLTIKGRPVDATNYEFTYFLDGKPLTDNVAHRPIRHRIAYASAVVANVVAGFAKASSATSETLKLDYCAFGGRRGVTGGA